jgi:hypothetical protein
MDKTGFADFSRWVAVKRMQHFYGLQYDQTEIALKRQKNR